MKLKENELTLLLDEFPDNGNAVTWENQLQSIRIADGRCISCGVGKTVESNRCRSCYEEDQAN